MMLPSLLVSRKCEFQVFNSESLFVKFINVVAKCSHTYGLFFDKSCTHVCDDGLAYNLPHNLLESSPFSQTFKCSLFDSQEYSL